jgi:hypothetical protein
VNEDVELLAPERIKHCGGFRLGEYPELVDLVVAEALNSATWDLRRGRAKLPQRGADNEFVSRTLVASAIFTNMLTLCPPGTRLTGVEKVFVGTLNSLEVPENVRSQGQAGDKVPYDAMIYLKTE